MKFFILILFLTITEIVFSQDLCSCRPWVKTKLQPRGAAKHLIKFNNLITKKDTIDIRYIYGWQNLYADLSRSISVNPFKQSSKRKHNTPEDTLYVVKAYMWFVKQENFDCDFHIEVGTESGNDTRIVVEASQENESLQKKIKHRLDSLGLLILGCNTSDIQKAHFKKPLPVIITGAGFYDATHKPNTNHGDHHTKKYSWELHPLKDVIFL